MPDEEKQSSAWTLLTGHGHVLVEIARNPDARLRDIAAVAGITERAVQAIISDLEAAGYLTREREGRRNRYTVHSESLFRHPAQDGHRVGPLLDILATAGDPALLPGGADENETGQAGTQLPQFPE
ncbi:MAG TPA: helix-turn-helix domain-containing protein [Streptosporangiaceae bacterium]